VAVGNLGLGALPAGEWRRLLPDEIPLLQASRGTISRRPGTGRV